MWPSYVYISPGKIQASLYISDYIQAIISDHHSVTISFIHKKRQLHLIKKRKPNSTIAATNYRKISNVVRCLTRCDTKEHTSRICHLNIIKNPKKIWSWVNASQGYREPIPTLKYGESIISDDTAKATCFNNYLFLLVKIPHFLLPFSPLL